MTLFVTAWVGFFNWLVDPLLLEAVSLFLELLGVVDPFSLFGDLLLFPLVLNFEAV
jgi:hypothetical protein